MEERNATESESERDTGAGVEEQRASEIKTVPTTFRSVPGNSRPPSNQNAGFSLSIFSSAPPSVRTNAFHFSLPLEFFLCFFLILKHVHAHPSFLYFHSIFFTVLRQFTWIKTVNKKKKEKKDVPFAGFFSPDHQPYIVISFAFLPLLLLLLWYIAFQTLSLEKCCVNEVTKNTYLCDSY